MVRFQISKTIRPIWTRLDSFESLFNFQKLYKNDFLSQINTKPATPTFIKNGPNFTLFAAHFCSSPANPPGRDTGVKIGTDAGLDLNWLPEKSRSSRSSRSWDTVAQILSWLLKCCQKFPEPDFRSYFNMSYISRTRRPIRTRLESMERSLYDQKLCLLNRSRQTDQKGTRTSFRGQGQTLLFSGHLTLTNFFSSSTGPNFTKLSTPTLHHPPKKWCVRDNPKIVGVKVILRHVTDRVLNYYLIQSKNGIPSNCYKSVKISPI